MDQKWSRRIQELRALRDTGGSQSSEFESEYAELKHVVFKELCPKTYKEECDPAYCTLRYTKTCEYLKVWPEIERQLASEDE